MTPTAEEFLIIKNDRDFRLSKSGEYISDLLIEFAKLHCTEQARIISEKAELKEVFTYDTDGTCQIANDMGDMYELDKDSILNAYPLDNIR
jgi:hypothetical protein